MTADDDPDLKNIPAAELATLADVTYRLIFSDQIQAAIQKITPQLADPTTVVAAEPPQKRAAGPSAAFAQFLTDRLGNAR